MKKTALTIFIFLLLQFIMADDDDFGVFDTSETAMQGELNRIKQEEKKKELEKQKTIDAERQAQDQQQMQQQAMEVAKAKRLAELTAKGYVDLGLPSGTLWASSNADDYVDYYDAASYGRNLPTAEQFEELSNRCRWSWSGYGYTVTGPNGNHIYLSNEGFRNCEGNKHKTESQGHYWTSSTRDSKGLFFRFGNGYRKITNDKKCSKKSIRLVETVN